MIRLALIKQLKHRWGPALSSLIPLDLWHRLLDIRIVLPLWHMVSDNEIEHAIGLYKFRNIRQFKADLEFFLRFYTPVSLQDIIYYLDGFGRLPKRCFLPTFDDGFREIHDIIAPILHARGIPAVFFLTTSFIDNRELGYPQKKSLLIRTLQSHRDSQIKREVARILTNAGVIDADMPSRIRSIYYSQRQVLDEVGSVLDCDFTSYVSAVQPYLTSGQIKNLLKMGFDIGAHSVDHPLYSELNLEEQLNQTKDSLEFIYKHFRYNCNAFAFPYGDADIASDFFYRAFLNKQLKVTFGNGGSLQNYFPRNLPRFSMERTDLPAAQILTRQFGRTILSGLLQHIKKLSAVVK